MQGGSPFNLSLGVTGLKRSEGVAYHDVKTKDMDAQFFEGLKSVDPEEFATALNENAPQLYQTVFRKGHSVATADLRKKIDERESVISEKESSIAQLQQSIDELKQAQPDIGKIQGQYENVIKELQGKLTEKESGYKKQLDEWKGRYKARNVAAFQEGLKSALIEAGVLPEYAGFKAQTAEVVNRLRFTDDGDIEGVFQSDGIVPLPVPDGYTVTSALAKELLPSISTTFIENRSQRGGKFGNAPDGQPGVVVISKADARDRRKFLAAVEQAGGEARNVRVSDD